MPVPISLDLPVVTYPWGSPTALAELSGRAPTGEPEAELWAGAHPDAPSLVAGRSLAELIAQDPRAMLGQPVLDRFGPRLPFLLKVLAIAAPLSIQVHPTPTQAAAGFERDDAAGIPLDSPERNYRDRSAKPEMLVALSEVRALAGFRPAVEAAEAIASLEVASLREVVGTLRTGGSGALEAVARQWLGADGPELAALCGDVTKAAQAGTGELAGLIAGLAERYPGDRGVLLALLLQPVSLAPGEALFIDSGVPHAYLSGLAVEAQASSNNTLRAGLTGKRVNTEEVVRLLTYNKAPDAIGGVELGKGIRRYNPGAAAFVLDRVALGDPVAVDLVGPRIVLCTQGRADVRADGGAATIGAGEAVFCPAYDGDVLLSGEGTAFVVAPGGL